MNRPVSVYMGEALARYAFGADHPFGPYRHGAFEAEFRRTGLDREAAIRAPALADQETVEWFHTHEYVERVKTQSKTGRGYLDWGDTPAFPGVFEAASTVVGTTLAALHEVVTGEIHRAFVPIAGLHHARRDSAAGFCVFNDCGVAIEVLRRHYDIRRVAYVDIDAHHGDGVFYGFEDDPDLIFVDFHEDGRYLYPGTGRSDETGTGGAAGTKRNIPMAPGATDEDFVQQWEEAETFLRNAAPEVVLLQCGADSLAGDPITHLGYSEAAHAHAARRLCAIADEYSHGRILALGGGGYNLDNLARAWTAVVRTFLEA